MSKGQLHRVLTRGGFEKRIFAKLAMPKQKFMYYVKKGMPVMKNERVNVGSIFLWSLEDERKDSRLLFS